MEETKVTIENPRSSTVQNEVRELMHLLGQHFGDRMVYLQGNKDRRLFKLAVEEGLVTEDGYITIEGYRAWQRAGSI